MSNLQPADREDYVLCPGCSQEQGKEIWYPKIAISERDPHFLSREPGKVRSCPRGHEIPAEAPAGGVAES